jgi:leucine-zipper of insertion element IS481
MDVHDNARTTRHSRMLMVQRLASGWTVQAVAAAAGVTPRTARKWRSRHALEGAAGLIDRSSRPHHSPNRQSEQQIEAIVALRRQRLTAPPLLGGCIVRSPPSALCCAAPGSAASAHSIPNPPSSAINARTRANSSISTSRSSVASTASATASPAIAPAKAISAGPAGNMSMSPSMTPHASPTRNCVQCRAHPRIVFVARRLRASARRPCSPHSQARSRAARSSSDFACWARTMRIAC